MYTKVKRRKSCNNDMFGGVSKMTLKRGLYEYTEEKKITKSMKRRLK